NRSRKARDSQAVGILSITISDIQAAEKRNVVITDDVVISLIKKQLESLAELQQAKKRVGRDIQEEETAQQLLQTFLPQELSREQLEAEVSALVGDKRDIKQMKQVSADLKSKGLAFDNKILAEILKSS
ncbi:MAG TPA: GatB/YqeY domain-containing protein, partial [Coleofasciculaceae cyanobacterium]